MKEPQELVINTPQEGVASSPLLGYGNVRDLDIYSIPGVVKLNNVLALESSTTITNLPLWIVKNPASPAKLYAFDLAGAVWQSADSGDSWSALAGNTAGAVGQGAIVWKDYLFVTTATKIDVYGPISGTPSWTLAWQTIDSDATWHPMIVSKNDGMLYGGAGRYVFSIEENSGQNFAPGTGATFTFTAQDLDLPEDYRIRCLSELGERLAIGTWQGTNIYDLKIADVFLWDRFSPSFETPIQLNENGVCAMMTIGSYLYIAAGIEGKIYKSNGSDAVLIAQIPAYVADLSGGKYIEVLPGAFINYKGRPTFGLSVGGTGNIAGMGVWSLQETSKGNILTLDHTISTTSDGYDEVLKIGSLLGITRDQLVVGRRDASSYGVERTATTTYGTANTYVAYFDSPFYKVGTPFNKRTFTDLEIQFADTLAANEGIKIQYRNTLTGTFTTIGTYAYTAATGVTTIGAVSSHRVTPDIPACEFLQFRVFLTGTTTSAKFKNITLR